MADTTDMIDMTDVTTGEEETEVIAEAAEKEEVVVKGEIAETNSAMCKWRDGSTKKNCAIEQLRNFQIIRNVTA